MWARPQGTAGQETQQLRKEGRISGELACAFIYVGNFTKGEGAGSTQAKPWGEEVDGRPPEFTQQEILGQGAPTRQGSSG